MCVSMDYKQSAEVKIIGIHCRSEESQGSVDIGTLVLGKVKGALCDPTKEIPVTRAPSS